MDFAWVVDALRRGLKVTRKGWLLTNSTMYMKMVRDTELNCNVARLFCMGRQASTWCPTQAELFEFTDWEEYVEPKKEPAYITKLPFIMTEQDTHGGKPVADMSDEEHQKQLLDMLVNAFAELVSQRVAQLLQDKKDTNHV